MNFALPFIHGYSAKIQWTILFVLLLVSYLNRRARGLIGILSIGVLIYTLAVPLSLWTFYAFKGVAMFGLYVKFFLVGMKYIKSAIDYLLPNFLDGLVEAWERSEEESRLREEQRRRQAEWEEAMKHVWEEKIHQEHMREEGRKQETKGQGRKKEGKRRR